MSTPVIYADLNVDQTQGSKDDSPLPLPPDPKGRPFCLYEPRMFEGMPQTFCNHSLLIPIPPAEDACQCPRWHQWALKLGCAGLILLGLSVIGLSVSVRILIQKSSIEESDVVVQENRTETTGRPALLMCPTDWERFGDKCLFVSQHSQPWDKGSEDCASKEATLLLIQDQEELKFIEDLAKKKEKLIWIGLKSTASTNTWKWINDSTLNSNILQITGEAKENSCALISQENIISESCSSDNSWICQKIPKPA